LISALPKPGKITIEIIKRKVQEYQRVIPIQKMNHAVINQKVQSLRGLQVTTVQNCEKKARVLRQVQLRDPALPGHLTNQVKAAVQNHHRVLPGLLTSRVKANQNLPLVLQKDGVGANHAKHKYGG